MDDKEQNRIPTEGERQNVRRRRAVRHVEMGTGTGAAKSAGADAECHAVEFPQLRTTESEDLRRAEQPEQESVLPQESVFPPEEEFALLSAEEETGIPAPDDTEPVITESPAPELSPAEQSNTETFDAVFHVGKRKNKNTAGRRAAILAGILIAAALGVCGYRYLTASQETLAVGAESGKELSGEEDPHAGMCMGYTVLDGDGNAVLYAASEAEILSAWDTAEEILLARYAASDVLPADADIVLTGNYTLSAGWVETSLLSDENALLAAFCDAENPLYSCTVTRAETVSELIPYETTYIPNDENFNNVKTMVSEGKTGLVNVTYTVTLDPLTGEELSRAETARSVVREAVSAVAYEGTYPVPAGTSTGTYVWPLPELPDDEMPLDENGEPYMPTNALALKNTYVSSGYGERTLWGAYDFHLGLDIVAPVWTEIYACDGGVVTWATYTSSYGYMVRIKHENGVETVYAHQAKLAVQLGDIVEQGQLIGYVGSSGSSSGCHLHLEFRYNHVTTDPLEYISIPEDVLVLGDS
ncbi:MAG: peptidoglycan DD-metalloendopeptidase family protein [Clostridia bacterium]|nr:peptidoglycan DD-metalloendopeptidase family protein [Clostridia bacterium]